MLTDWKGTPQSLTVPWSSHSRVGQRQLAQTTVPADRRAAFWAAVVAAKVDGQAATLMTRKPRLGRMLGEMSARVVPGDATGVEAAAAQFYFRKLWGKDFVRDHAGGDRTNALLNYGYGILRGAGARAVLRAGLSPVLGIRHSHRSNPWNLVADLMEPFRPAVDHAVLALPARSSLTQVETKKALAAVMPAPFDGSGRSLAAVFDDLAVHYALFLQDESIAPQVPRWIPPEVR